MGSTSALAWCKDAAGNSYSDAPGDASSLCNISLGIKNGDYISQNNTDWFRFQGIAGTAYRIHAFLGGGGDLRLAVLNSSGSQLFFNDNGSVFTKNPVLGFVAPYTGLYYAQVKLGPFTGNTHYTIVRTLINPDPSCPAGTIAGFNRGREFTGVITRGSTAKYCFGARAGSYVAWTVAQQPGAANPLRPPVWLLREVVTGSALSFQTNPGPGRYEYQLPNTGTYLLEISGNNLLDDGAGAYVLRRLE